MEPGAKVRERDGCGLREGGNKRFSQTPTHTHTPQFAVTDALVLNGMLALRPPNVAPLTGGGVARLARARGAALEAWGAPPSGAAAGDAPDAYARARAAAWSESVAAAPAAAWSESVAAAPAAQPAVAAAQPAARPPPPAAPLRPPPPPPAAPKPDPDIVVLSDDDDDDRCGGSSAAATMPPWPRAPLAAAAAAAAVGGTPSLALARVAAVTSPLRFMDAATQAPLPEFGLDIDLAPCGGGDDGGGAPRVAAALAPALAARLLGRGATPASMVAAYAADGADAVLGSLAGLKRGLAAFRGWVALERGRDGRPVVTAWWPA